MESSLPLDTDVANRDTLQGLSRRKEEATLALSYLKGGPLEIGLPKGCSLPGLILHPKWSSSRTEGP